MTSETTWKGPRIRILESAWKRMTAYIRNCPTELGGLGSVEIRGGDLVVTEVFLIGQKATSGDFRLTDDALAAFLHEWIVRGRKMEEIGFWWHSHAAFPAFWSSVDKDTTERLARGRYCIAHVGNHRDEHRTCLALGYPLPMTIDGIPLEVVEERDLAFESKILDEIKEKVARPPLLTKSFPFIRPVESLFGERGEE